MNISEIKIVADSSADIFELENIPFKSAPLKIITAEKEFTDNKELDISEMTEYLNSYEGKSSTSCPNTNDYIEAFGDAKYIFCITITAELSGSYNAACLAKQTYEELYADRKVFVMNSLTTGPEMYLIINKFKELILAGNDFETACTESVKYSKETGLFFMLESLKNIANNGRVSHLVAKMTGILGIRMVGKASDRGELELLNKCRGEKKALHQIFEHLTESGYNGGKIRIMHCFNEQAAITLKNTVENVFPYAEIEIAPCGGLCSFYAEKGGLIIGYEKE